MIHDAFLKDIIENPNDDSLRLIFAACSKGKIPLVERFPLPQRSEPCPLHSAEKREDEG
jgi:hypothetical protein